MSYEEVLTVFDPPVLEFKAGKKSIDPVQAFAIQGCEPLKVPSIEGPAEIHVLIPSKLEESISVMKILQDLRAGKTTGKYARSKYKPFRELYGLDLEIRAPEKYDDQSDIYKKITEISRLKNKPSHIVVIVSSSRSQLGGFYYRTKVASIQKGVQTQLILQKTIDSYVRKKTEEEKGDLLWNFSLSIFSKLGGIPWKLQEMLRGVSAFISLNTVSSYEEELGITTRGGVVALEVANSWGDPTGRFFAIDVKVEREDEEAIVVDLASVNTLLKNALDMIEQRLIDPERSKADDYIIVHVKDRYAESVYEAIGKVITSEGFKKYKIIHLQEDGGLRLYDPSQKPTRAWPQEGSYWYLEDGRIAFLFTLGKWQYSVSAATEPYMIEAKNVSPLQVNFVNGSKRAKLTDDDLIHLYHLTRLHYYSADVPRIKMPSTVRLGQRAARLAASGLNNSDFDVSFLY